MADAGADSGGRHGTLEVINPVVKIFFAFDGWSLCVVVQEWLAIALSAVHAAAQDSRPVCYILFNLNHEYPLSRLAHTPRVSLVCRDLQ